MYGITNGQSIQLLHTTDNSDGQLEVDICDVTYYPRWTNISAARDNNKILIGEFNDSGNISKIIPTTISDGYYSIFSLKDEGFKPFGASLPQNESNGMLLLSTGEKGVYLSDNIKETLRILYEKVVKQPNEMELNYPI